jgi:hypothetical protein
MEPFMKFLPHLIFFVDKNETQRIKRVKIAVFKLEIHKQLPLDVDVDLGFDGTPILKIIFLLR